MPNYYMICADCNFEYTVPTSIEDPFRQPCPNCSSKNVCQRFGVKNTICIDKMKDCSNCPFNGNCALQEEKEA